MKEENKPLTLSALKEAVDHYFERRSGRELTVCIPNNKGGMGGTSVTNVISVHGGIDWDAGKFFIHPEVKMIERPPDFTESNYQYALQRIKSLEMISQRLITAIEMKDDREIGFALRFAKTSLDIFKKKPIN